MIDHPIFIESIQFIREELGALSLEPLQQSVLERMIHTSGDFAIKDLLRFSPNACELGLAALKRGAEIVADTSMASVAIQPMAKRTLKTQVHNVLDWAPSQSLEFATRTGFGMKQLWKSFTSDSQRSIAPLVAIGSSPTALEILLDLVDQGANPPSLIVGMPVEFIGVEKSKERLSKTNIPFVLIEGTRGGAALAASAINALLRATIND